jgi:hypothetical protein
MKTTTRRRLDELADRAGKEYGKIVQKLLALALLEVGVSELTERAVQGLDLEFVLGGRRCACEVKTTAGDAIRLGRKDIEGLEGHCAKGATVYLAVLGGSVLDDLAFIRFHPGELQASKDYPLVQLRAYRDAELGDQVGRAFADCVESHFTTATGIQAQRALNEILARDPAWRQA